MIQLNLLPDVKLEYIKARRTKRLVIVTSMIVSVASLSLLLLVVSIVYGAQKYRLNSLDTAIKDSSKKLLATPDLNKVLTVQNQLNRLDELHSETPVSSRLAGYLQQVTPNDVQISSVELKYEDTTLQISGVGKSLEAVNKYVDTLKFTKFSTDGSTDSKQAAFTTVVLDSWAPNDKGVLYSIKFKFDPALFSRANKQVTLIVPKITSTRSETERPTVLFKEQPQTKEGQ